MGRRQRPSLPDADERCWFASAAFNPRRRCIATAVRFDLRLQADLLIFRVFNPIRRASDVCL
jgi:hypothetical protein